jgi:hypothetical protein
MWRKSLRKVITGGLRGYSSPIAKSATIQAPKSALCSTLDTCPWQSLNLDQDVALIENLILDIERDFVFVILKVLEFVLQADASNV